MFGIRGLDGFGLLHTVIGLVALALGLWTLLRRNEFDVAHGILVSAADWLISKDIRQWTTAYWKVPA